MTVQSCGSSVQACAVRVAVLEADGVPLPGAGNLYVTDNMVKLDVTPVYFKGVDIQQPNACGGLATYFKARDVFIRNEFALSLGIFDPDLDEMLTGGQKFSQSGFTVGGSMTQINTIGRPWGVSLELWSKNITNGDINPVWPYIRWVIPRSYWQHDKATFDNGPKMNDFTGYSTENPNWFNGPANDWSFSSDRSMAWAYTKTLPNIVCGAQTLVGS